MLTYTQIVGLLCVIATAVFRVVPLIGMVRLFQTHDIRPIPVVIYFSTLLSTSFWTVYGIQIHIWEIWTMNGSAIVIMPIYLTLYLYFLPGLNTIERLIMIILLFAMTNTLLFTAFNFFTEDVNGAIASSLSFVVQTNQIFIIIQDFTNKKRYNTILFKFFCYK